MSPTFRRAVRVQKRLLVTERGDLRELLKLKNERLFFHKIIVHRNDVEKITCAMYGNFRNLIFDVWKYFSRVQQLFVGDRLPWITLSRNALWQ